jgi:hypothetical protein
MGLTMRVTMPIRNSLPQYAKALVGSEGPSPSPLMTQTLTRCSSREMGKAREVYRRAEEGARGGPCCRSRKNGTDDLPQIAPLPHTSMLDRSPGPIRAETPPESGDGRRNSIQSHSVP